MAMTFIYSAFASILARIILPLVLLSLAVSNAPALHRVEDLNKKFVCPKCGHATSPDAGDTAPPEPGKEALPPTTTTNGTTTNGTTTKDIPKAAPKPISRTGSSKPKLPAAPPVVEPESEEDDDDEFPGDSEADNEMDEDQDGEVDDEPEDTVVQKAVDYSKAGEGDDPDAYNISGEVAVNLDDPKIQDEIREAAKHDPTLRKELLKENRDQADKIKEILGDDDNDDDDDDDDDVDALDTVEAEVAEVESLPAANGKAVGGAASTTLKAVKKKVIFTKVNNLLADQAARMTLKKKIQLAAVNTAATKRTVSESKGRKDTTMTADGGSSRFSMIMAVSQGYLNSQLMFRHAITPAMHRMAVKLDNGAEINAALNAPQISLHFDDGTASSALYHMSFGAGTCKLWNGTDLVECNPANWKYAFMVNLSLDKLDSTSSEADEVTKSWGKPGNYSISRLLVDLKSADLVSDYPEHTKMGDFKHTKKTLTSFKCLLLAWMQQAESSGGMVMGHSLTANNTESVVDKAHSDVTIPTSQMLQTYPYIPKGETEADEGLEADANSNMLVFLNMTKGRDFPASKALSYTGNWCTPEIPGTLCIARQVLFDDFLLPLLVEVNRSTHVEPTRCRAKFQRLKSKIDFDIGKGKHPDSWFNWKPTDNPKHNPSWTAWEWRSSGTKEDKDGRKNIYCRGKISTTVLNTIKPIAGTNRIEVSCTAKVSLESKVASIGGRKGNAVITRTGKFEVCVKSVSDGNVELAIDGLQPGSSPLKFDINTKTSTQGLAFLTPQFFKRLEDDMRNEVNDNANLKKMATRIQESIGTVGTFVVPGGGHFFMEGAIFNNARDLLFETEYKGAN